MWRDPRGGASRAAAPPGLGVSSLDTAGRRGLVGGGATGETTTRVCFQKCFAVRVCGAFPRVYRTAGTVQLYASTAQYSHRPGTEDAWV